MSRIAPMPRRWATVALILLSIVLATCSADAADSEVATRPNRKLEDHPPHKPHKHHSSGTTSASTSGGGSSSGGGGGGGGGAAGVNSASKGPKLSSTNGLMLVGAAVAAGAAIAAAAYRRRRTVETAEPHPLAGAVNRRMNMFNHLAGKAGEGAARPERVVDDTDLEGGTPYHRSMDGDVAMV